MIVVLVIVGAIVLAIYGLSRQSQVKGSQRSGGTSLRRTRSSHINANGTPKRGYETLAAAEEAARTASAHSNQAMSAYKCATCQLDHIGHS